jgi:hypothetical protein
MMLHLSNKLQLYLAHTLEINGYDEEINSKNGWIMMELSSFL